jgi:hypothetical protein
VNVPTTASSLRSGITRPVRDRLELALKKEFFPSIKGKIGSFPGPAVHEIVTPLSTGYTCPVTIRDSSEAKNTAMLAMSSGSISPTRCAAASFVTRGLPAESGGPEELGLRSDAREWSHPGRNGDACGPGRVA